MESTNLHHHHHHHQLHQDHQLIVSAGNNHPLTSNHLLNSSGIHTSSGEVVFRDLNQRSDIHVDSPHGNSNLQELGCHSWLNSNRFVGPSPEQDHHQYLGDMKEEINSESSSSFSNFTDLLNSGNLSRIQQESDEEEQKQMNDLSEKLLLKTLLLSPNYHVDSALHPLRGAFAANNVPFTVGNTLNAGQIHPTVNISNLRNISSGFSGSMDHVNLQALDFFSMDRPSAESVNRPMDSNDPGLGEDCSEVGFTDMHQYSRLKQSVDPENLPSFNNNGALTGPKRPKPKAPQSVSKRPRAESRVSCPPLKVRKEKLGDRIAALQQLVAPFGKTDTASVLMEAFGYIKFLHNQVETLSVPYMKLASRHKRSNSMQEGSGGGGEAKADLRSQGLCLVPLSCMSYITTDGEGGIWPPHSPNFNPGF